MSVPMPRIYTCPEWGAKDCGRMSMVAPGGITVHHTTGAAANSMTLEDAKAVARSIQQSHLAQGWVDTGQHFTLSGGGHVLEGRHMTVDGLTKTSPRLIPVGAHAGCADGNHTIGIEVDGYFEEDQSGRFHPMGQVQWTSLVGLCAWLCSLFGWDPAKKILGHKDWGVGTACPGSWFYQRLPQLRREVASALGGAKPVPALRVLLEQLPIACNPRVENGVTRVDLRAVVEALGAQLEPKLEEGMIIVHRGEG